MSRALTSLSEIDSSDLKFQNADLRKKLKEFNSLLDKHIRVASNGTISFSKRFFNVSDSLHPSNPESHQLQLENKNLHKKIEIYKRTSEQLQKQLNAIGAGELIAILENKLAMKENEIIELMAELKSLKKAVSKNERETMQAMQSIGESKIQLILDENRALKEKLREASARIDNEEKNSRRQQEVAVKLQMVVRSLEEKIRSLEALRVEKVEVPKPIVDVDANKLKAEVEESHIKLQAAIGAKNLIEQNVRALKNELKNTKADFEAAKIALQEKDHELRKLGRSQMSIAPVSVKRPSNFKGIDSLESPQLKTEKLTSPSNRLLPILDQNRTWSKSSVTDCAVRPEVIPLEQKISIVSNAVVPKSPDGNNNLIQSRKSDLIVEQRIIRPTSAERYSDTFDPAVE